MQNSYQELASHQDDDAAIGHGRLGIEGGNLVLDLLEGEGLSKARQQVSANDRNIHPEEDRQQKHTTSFSTMPVAPRTEADSKVSIDCSRFGDMLAGWTRRFSSQHICMTHVESRKGLAIRVELVVVELNELLYCRKRETSVSNLRRYRGAGSAVLEHTSNILKV